MRIIIASLALATLSACAAPGARDRYDYVLKPTANPSEIVAAELAFARAAQEDGQWTAFRRYATNDAVMFVPQMVNAQDWLSKQADPAQAVRWQPHQVWSSCDGSLGVTRGSWQRPDGSTGYFSTVWERQRNGEYKWVMDQGDELTQPLAEPAMVGASVADCASAADPVVMSGRDGNVRSEGRSRDATLYWNVTVRPDNSRTIMVKLWKGGAMTTVIDDRVIAGS